MAQVHCWALAASAGALGLVHSGSGLARERSMGRGPASVGLGPRAHCTSVALGMAGLAYAADDAFRVCLTRRSDWQSVLSGLSKRGCLDPTHHMTGQGYRDEAAEVEAVADMAADMWRKAKHAGRPAACSLCLSSCADEHHHVRQCLARR